MILKDMLLAVLTYNVPHRKTYDTLCLLKAKGYENVSVFGQPMTYVKKRYPLVTHRPDMVYSVPDPNVLCKNLGFNYYEGDFGVVINGEYNKALFLLCGAGLLPDEFVRTHRIINSHPGYVPVARGLDAYKWSIWNKLPVGVTTHFLGEYVDAGEVIEQRKIEIGSFDTFHSVAQRVYENEIDMLVHAIELADNKHEMIIPSTGSEIFKRMPDYMEIELFSRFEEYKQQYIKL